MQRDITPAALSAQAEGTVIVDIRRSEEWRLTGVLAGSHRLTFFDSSGAADPDVWLAELAKIASPADDLVLVCRSGQRTGVILDYLASQTAYVNARHLTGGILAWLERGLPVVPFSV